MRIKMAIGMALLAWNVGLASAQYPPAPTGRPPAGTAITGGQPAEFLGPPATLSQWITYSYGDFGPVGGGIPVQSEVFLRSGFAVPTSVGNLGAVLELGWDIEAGGKLLFFDPAVERAWTVWASISNVANRGRDTDQGFVIVDQTPFFQVGVDPKTNQPIYAPKKVTVQSLNRTFVNLAIGREWYLFGSANTPENRWRVGVDTGGRWGSASVRLNEIQHRTDVIGGVFTGFYGDATFQVGACTILTGLRGEWDYTWSDILQISSDVMSINVLFTAGLLF
jgi:hypothetical protein